MLGLPYGKVFLVPWCEKWEFEFSKEKQLIEEHIGKYILAIHHIGSTLHPAFKRRNLLLILRWN